MYQVSVVMPIYNNEDTLRLAVESILNQSASGFELILINDGSTDASTQICKEYAKKEPLLIKMIHQERMGFTDARNTGLKHARGKYIYFAEPQTILARRMLESNLKLAEENSAELVVFGFNQHETSTDKITERIPKYPYLLSKERFRNHFRNYYSFFPYQLCNKLFEVNYLKKNNIYFNKHSLKAKALFNLDVYWNINRVVFNRKVYCQKNLSDTRNWQPSTQLYEQHLEFIDQLEKMLSYWGLAEEYTDLILREYYNLLENEVLKYMNPQLNLSNKELIIEVERLLTDERIVSVLEQKDNFPTKKIYEKTLWNNFRNRNTRVIIELIRRKNQTDKITDTVKRKITKWFN